MKKQEPDLNTDQISGHYKLFNDSQYIGAHDLLNEDGKTYKEITLKVKGVYRRDVWNKDKACLEKKIIFDFHGAKKDFICNPTNQEMMITRTGKELTQEWVGAEVTLVVRDVNVGREVKKGLRVK